MNINTSNYQQYIALSRYSRWIQEENRRETWDETVNRWYDYFSNKFPQIQSRPDIKQAIKGLQVMPSMRTLMTAGPALEKNNVAGYNCAYVAVDKIHAFDEAMFILMSGTGVGFSVERQFISKLPQVPNNLTGTYDPIIIEDSREGWAIGYRRFIEGLYKGVVRSIDVSNVRPKGERLKTFGGRASGPEPLVKLFKITEDVFKRAAGRNLTSIECHDIMCAVANCVVVGGVRRSAMISLSNLSDQRMRKSKMGQWWEQNPDRSYANNSVAYTEKPDMSAFMDEWKSLYDSKSGERGIFNRMAAKKQFNNIGREWDDTVGTNPCCVSGDTFILTDKGNVRIDSVVGQKVNIWNGEDWAEVAPYEAGEAELYRVTLSNGVHLDCTDNHRWVLDGHNFVETEYISNGDKLQQFFIPNITSEYHSDFNIHIESVKNLEKKEMTYCFTEPKTSRGTFNGVVTGNSEILLKSNEFCNLTEVVIRSDDTPHTLKRKVEIATIIGTMQSAMIDFLYINDNWKKNTEEERLLGVSFTGIYDNEMMCNKTGDSLVQILRELKEHAINTNKEWAEKLGIPPSAAVTTVKPSGTVSQLVNSASGIHPRYSKYYVRRVRSDSKDPLGTWMEQAGIPCEVDSYNSNNKVFSFPIKSPENCVTRHEVSAIDHLELWLIYKQNWSEHSVSVTIYVAEDEWLEVGAWVYKHFDEITGVSFLPKEDAGHTYTQAPYTEITKNEYNQLEKDMPNIDFTTYREFEDKTTSSQEFACTGNSCEL